MHKSELLIFDNYDSFTYNLVHLTEKILHKKVDVVKNNECSASLLGGYEKIIFSPGPGLPHEAGVMKELILQEAGKASILGVCLGLQAIAEAFGGKLRNLKTVQHGVSLPVQYSQGTKIFEGLSNPFNAGRYHSWVVEKEGLPECFQVIAKNDEGEVMALQHKTFDIAGVQFHPESILTPQGELLMRNWLFKY